MKVAFVTFEYPPFIMGGAGIYATNITRELAKLGHQVIVFTPQINDLEEKKDELNNLEIERIRMNKRLPFKALQFWLHLPSEVKKVESKKRFDIIHFNGISYWFLKNRISKAPHVITVHHLVQDAIRNNNLSLISRIKDVSGENNLFIPFIEKRCVKCVDRIIAVSNFTKKQITTTYKIPSDKVKVVYNGVDLNGYTFIKEEMGKTKKQLNLDRKPTILFVGRIDDPRKGLDLLLKAFKKVLGKNDAMLLVVGKGDQTEAKKLATSLGIAENVVFSGFVEEATLKRYYALCEVYVCPSRLEGFGLTILEAMATGKPIVATDVGAIPEIIKSEENGILVELGNINELSSAICRFLHDKKIVEQIGKRNADYVKEKFSWVWAAKETERIYYV
jgi:glycosyltransferase involved in cell wall biosynthesis